MLRTGILPNFLIVGAARGGTTNFAAYLRGHPEVFMPPKRPEPHFFLKDPEYSKGLAYYSEKYFATAGAVHAVGEASTSYVCHRFVAERIARDLPGVRLFVMLRNPIPRALSSYWHTVRNGLEPLSFPDALKAESVRAAAAEHAADPLLKVIRPFAYVERGMYARQLRSYLDFFPRERLSVILFEEFVADPIGVTRAACAFLGLDPSEFTPPPAARDELNQSTPAGESMDDDTFEFLRSAYRDDVRDLSGLLDRDLSGWLDRRTDGPSAARAS